MELMDTPFILLLDALAPARAQLARQLPACRALHAENCEEALTFLHTCPVSLVLADCTRPASQGPQLLARMQLEPALSAIPVLALVSLENETAVEQAYSLGAFDTIAVPVLPAVLYRRVLNILHAPPLYRPAVQGRLWQPGPLGATALFLCQPDGHTAPAPTVPPKAFTLSQLGTLGLFHTVRLIASGSRQAFTVTADGALQPDDGPCYMFWDHHTPCDICLHTDAIKPGEPPCAHAADKFEFAHGRFYHAFSCPVTVDGQSYSMEIVRSVPERALLDLCNDADLSHMMEEFNEKLYVDSLTRVYNRRYYDERVPFLGPHDALAMLDLDNFKTVNDQYGHAAGDSTLQAVAAVLLGSVRKTDAVIRYGGDEFVLVFRDIPPDVFAAKLEAIRHTIGQTPLGLPGGMRLTASVGGVMGPGPTSSLVRRADALMYCAKERRNRVVVDLSPAH